MSSSAQHAVCHVLLSYRGHLTGLALRGWLLLGFIISLCSPKSKEMGFSYLFHYVSKRAKQVGDEGQVGEVLHCCGHTGKG